MATKRWLGNTSYTRVELGRTWRYESFSRVYARDFSTSFQWEKAFQSINQSINRSINFINQSISSINQSIKQSISSINQSIIQSIKWQKQPQLRSRKRGVPFETAALMAEEKSVTTTFFAQRLRANKDASIPSES